MRFSYKTAILLSFIFIWLWIILLWSAKARDFVTNQKEKISYTFREIVNKEPEDKSIYLVAWWDIMLSRNIWYFAKQEWYDRIFREWNYNPINHFSGCLWEKCILFFNLESLFNENDYDFPKAWFTFRANTGNIQTLLQLRWDHTLALSLANNHTINATYSGVVLTRNILSENDIYHAGVGLSTWESREFIRIQQNDIKLCIWAYSYDWKFVKVWAGKMARNPNDENQIKQDLQKMIDENCDVKIISLHRWAEYRISPNKKQIQLAHNLIDAWADLILWWHSHVPWDYEIYNGKYVFYSFWNFIFDQWWWKRTTDPYERIFDYSLNKKTVPTYISLLAGLKIQKFDTWVTIDLDELKMNTSTDWILQPLDEQTYAWILERIKKN